MSTLLGPTKTETTVTRRDVLHRAADLIEEFGWCQGTGGMPFSPNTGEREPKHNGEFCLLGSIAQAVYDLLRERISYDAVEYLYGEFRSEMSAACWKWNDAPERTYRDVVKRLREAAEAV
jgi:hypothetical protein